MYWFARLVELARSFLCVWLQIFERLRQSPPARHHRGTATIQQHPQSPSQLLGPCRESLDDMHRPEVSLFLLTSDRAGRDRPAPICGPRDTRLGPVEPED